MKIKNTKLCPECDEVFEGQACPSCSFEGGIYIADKLGVLSEDGGHLVTERGR